MRIPSPDAESLDNDSLHSWREYKEQGKRHYESGNYSQALRAFRSSLNPDLGCPRIEQQILLSNAVACRLKIGGTAMAEVAVKEAKQCVALNDKWAKGQIRLAEAYIALGDHSNDACNALQRALAVDRGNATARQLLLRELRRDHHSPVQQPSSVPLEEDGDASTDEQRTSPRNNPFVPPASAPPTDDATTRTDANTAYQPNNNNNRDDIHIDDSFSIFQKIQFKLAELMTWYQNEFSDESKTILKIIIGLVVLYVAFGGRFGLDELFSGSKRELRGNYGSGNVYDQYHGRGKDARPTGASTGYSSKHQRYGNDDASSYQGQSSRNNEYIPRQTNYHGSSSSQSSSFHFPNLFDGSLPSLVILGAIGYLCHRFGINPFHVIGMLNMVTGNRGGGRMNMQRMGMAGMGYGMFRNHMRGGGRQRQNRW
mmetsp:Transcript_2647/g.4802  ORF Transcript_2647/g.4802 Transcript_2647/m.4802 type:complete len:426 (-) Transcript_2647:52-1329(-)